jgi:hypothetical protein
MQLCVTVLKVGKHRLLNTAFYEGIRAYPIEFMVCSLYSTVARMCMSYRMTATKVLRLLCPVLDIIILKYNAEYHKIHVLYFK